MEFYLLQCKIYFDINPAKFPTNKVRVKFAINLFRGEAFGWFKHIMKDYLTNLSKNQDPDIINIYSSWANYETALHSIFGKLNEERITEQKLQILT